MEASQKRLSWHSMFKAYILDVYWQMMFEYGNSNPFHQRNSVCARSIPRIPLFLNIRGIERAHLLMHTPRGRAYVKRVITSRILWLQDVLLIKS